MGHRSQATEAPVVALSVLLLRLETEQINEVQEKYN